jgi:hypothetical protein
VLHSTGQSDVLTLSGEYDGVISAFNSVPHGLLEKYRIIGLWGDDVRMHNPSWESIVLSKLDGKRGLLYGRDGYQNQKLPTHPFISSEIFVRLGFMYPLCLHHYYGDNYLKDLLGPLNMVHYAEELNTEHLHPDAGKSVLDDTYRRSRRWWDADTVAYAAYCKNELAADRERVVA